MDGTKINGDFENVDVVDVENNNIIHLDLFCVLDGEPHSKEGPALVSRKEKVVRYFLYNKEYNFDQWSQFCNISPETKLELYLKYGNYHRNIGVIWTEEKNF